jgi:hypothetical protein
MSEDATVTPEPVWNSVFSTGTTSGPGSAPEVLLTLNRIRIVGKRFPHLLLPSASASAPVSAPAPAPEAGGAQQQPTLSRGSDVSVVAAEAGGEYENISSSESEGSINSDTEELDDDQTTAGERSSVASGSETGDLSERPWKKTALGFQIRILWGLEVPRPWRTAVVEYYVQVLSRGTLVAVRRYAEFESFGKDVLKRMKGYGSIPKLIPEQAIGQNYDILEDFLLAILAIPGLKDNSKAISHVSKFLSAAEKY